MTIKRLKINGGRWLGDVELRGSVGTGEGVMAAPEWQMRAEPFGIVATRGETTVIVPWHRVDGAEVDGRALTGEMENGDGPPSPKERDTAAHGTVGATNPVGAVSLTEEQDATTPGVASQARRRGRAPKQSGDV